MSSHFDPDNVVRLYGYVDWDLYEDEYHVLAEDYDKLLVLYREASARAEREYTMVEQFKAQLAAAHPSIAPLKAGNWSAEEWNAAESVVFALRMTYPPDSLAAIYRDIAINLQAEITRVRRGVA